ncbi:unnamed protein product [Eruca vesicaria subsp. sativa]|uniref:ADP-ribosyl cyclase/cyclic ADP-ribose hydrolase n=1 Tax=Eruca vesicaria subsp. sativa TaxID=29727 RepID=A0ABC8JTB4_ERUVS|nr:unnamed protein product [Eruca vesicaria subsp. sativa]
MAASSSSQGLPDPESWQVFINFRGVELRDNFVSHLEVALTQAGINYYIDRKETRSEDLKVLFKRIQQSQIALPIISSMYAESNWCLDELVEIMEQVENGNLKIIPIFFNVTPEEVKDKGGRFRFMVFRENEKNGKSIADLQKWNEGQLIVEIVNSVKKVLAQLEAKPNVLPNNVSPVTSGGNPSCPTSREKPFFEDEMNRRLKQLKEKISFKSLETQIVGIVGMPGIGKTNLAEMQFHKKKTRFVFKKIVSSIREKSEQQEPDCLKKELLNGQECNDSADMFKRKIFVVLDDVSDKKQIDFLMEKLSLVKKGSKIVITTRDKSSIAGLAQETYVVPGLNDKDALELFEYHAFNDQTSSPEGSFLKLSKQFVDYAGGNPLALEALGKELCGQDEAHWEKRLLTLPHCCNRKIKTELKISYDKLSDQEKDAFLDIACFFRSEEEDYVKCLLDQYDSESGEDAVGELAQKLLISISAGRIEMHNLLCTFGKEIGSSDENMSGQRMWAYKTITETLCLKELISPDQTKQGKKKVRGIFLDTSKEEQVGTHSTSKNGKENTKIPLDMETFTDRFNQTDLRYLKIYDSLCPQNCKVILPDGLEFPFQEVRYLHWQNFPLEELPPDFNPQNLIDLRLTHSKMIERLWEDVKEVPRLKWVDLSYSTKLTDLSAVSNASHLRRLNLEGCEILKKLPEDMVNMRSLVFLNLRDCVMLSSLPDNLVLVSLKTLILSGCSRFTKFDLVSKNLEFLHLDGTAIESLPSTIQDFKKLVLLNLKNCKRLESLPDCLEKLKALEELMLSGCFKLKRLPEIKEKMEKLQILLLDGTSIQCRGFSDQLVNQQPLQINSLSMLRRLCLSSNDMIYSLQSSISELYHLKWIDLRYCTNLTSLLTLPPNLQYLNAHSCTSLKTVASPLALLNPTEQLSSSFIFTNCDKLEHVAKNEIICYAHSKSQRLSDALHRHNKGVAFENLVATCFPGSEVPVWFNYRASGAVLERELLPSDNGFVGIALCAVVSFENYKAQNNNFMVKCLCEFNNVDTSSTFFSFHIGDLSEEKEDQRTIKSTHVFIGFTSWLNINHCKELDLRRRCGPAKACISFLVTDGTREVAKCKVLKCGFSLVCESGNGSWDANADASDDASSEVTESDSCFQDAIDGPIDSESDNDNSSDKKAGEVRQGESRLWGFLRRGWLITLSLFVSSSTCIPI